LLNVCHALENNRLGEYRLDGVISEFRIAGRGEPPFHQGMQGFYIPYFGGLPLHLYRYHPLREFSREEAGHLMSRRSVLMLPYYFMVGCPFNCAFCGESYDDAYRVKPIEEIVEDLKALKKKYRANHFFFLNDMVNPSREFAARFSRALIEADLDVRWSDCAHFGPLDKELIFQLREAGAVRLIYGLESGSERLLRYANKHFTLQHASNVLRWSHEAGIWNEIEIICGLPYEEDRDINATAKFIGENLAYINYCHPNRFQLKRSRFLKTPERFGLSNVSPVNHEYHYYRFDEVRGLDWEEKELQIQRSYEMVESVVGEQLIGSKGMHLYESDQNLPFLFYLYDLLDTKSEVEAVIHDRWNARAPPARIRSRGLPFRSRIYEAYHAARRLVAR